MKRTKAYNISRLQTVTYLQPFRHSSFVECALQPKIAKNNKNRLFWKFRTFQSHRCWYDWKARH